MARADTGRGLLALTFCLLSARGKGPGGRSREWASPARARARCLQPGGCGDLPAGGVCVSLLCPCVSPRRVDLVRVRCAGLWVGVGVSCGRMCPQRVPKAPGGIASARVAAAPVALSGACFFCPARTRLAVASVPERAGGAGVCALTPPFVSGAWVTGWG